MNKIEQIENYIKTVEKMLTEERTKNDRYYLLGYLSGLKTALRIVKDED